ncbi:MAG: 16S rRNA (guanine(966)-N(2))-methyltransferase RsmD [Candidatus Margulisiibacteriota bacterium]
MRIIAGSAKGKKIKALKSRSVRPLTDYAREALFNILTPRIAGARFLDLFAGSGAVGIEAVSRGAREAVFVEKNPKCVALIRSNLAECGFKDRARVYTLSVSHSLNVFAQSGEKFDIIFNGAPYGSPEFLLSLEKIGRDGLLEKGGLLIAEHHFKFEIDVAYPGLKKTRDQRYGDTVLSFFEVTNENSGLSGQF